jgi:NCS1 family nucleobase:cation symporter-1
MTLFAFLSVMVTSGSQAVYGEAIWDPVQLAAKTDNVVGLLFALVTVLVATLSVNIAANLVSPAFDFSNIAPRKISFRAGALVTCVLGVLIFPWKLYSDPQGYIFTWLGLVGGLLGTCTARAAATGTRAAGTGGPSWPSWSAVSSPSAAQASSR